MLPLPWWRSSGDYCTKGRVCEVNGCQEKHTRLLHGGKITKSKSTYSKIAKSQATERNESESGTKGEQKSATERSHTTMEKKTQTSRTHFTALRTVLVRVKNGNRSIVVNALLDDASTKTYLNAGIAAERKFVRETRRNTVNVFNGQMDSFENVPVEF